MSIYFTDHLFVTFTPDFENRYMHFLLLGPIERALFSTSVDEVTTILNCSEAFKAEEKQRHGGM